MKNKKLIVALSICILIFSVGIVHKTFQNDTYFTIATGNYIMENGVNDVEPFTWHQNLKFTKLRWGFDLVVAAIYNIAGYNGLYIFTVLMSALIGISLFFTLIKRKNNIIISFLMTLFVMSNLTSGLTCRGQIVSYLLFVLEIYSIQMLLDTGKKKYSVYLLLISLGLLSFHSSVWLAHFVFYVPYIFEWILNKIKINKILEKNEKIEIETRDKKVMKLFFITIAISLILGLCTPLKLFPFTYMFKVVGGYSSKIIRELQPIKIVNKHEVFLTVIGVLGLLSLTKTKVKLTDLCLIVGVLIMARLAYRNMFIAVVILAAPTTNIITSYIKAYNKEELFNKLSEKFNRNILVLIIAILGCLVLTTTNYKKIYKEPLVDEQTYPVGASKYILENVDLTQAKIYNHFNYGSYMELQGIPTFIDSRSEVYCKEFGGGDILEDFANYSIYLSMTSEDLVSKYGITHFVLKDSTTNASEMKNNDNYKLIYTDNIFDVFEVVNNK